MANRKRPQPLTDEEVKARNRAYQHKRRHKTDNGYSRAYRRAGQRAIQWFKDNKPAEWATWLAQEQTVAEENPYTPLYSKDPAHKGEILCMHDGDKQIIGLTVGCLLCGRAVGSVTIDDEVRKELNEGYEID